MQSKTLARGVSIGLFCIGAVWVVGSSFTAVRADCGAIETMIPILILSSPGLVGMWIGCRGVTRADSSTIKWVIGLLGTAPAAGLLTWTGIMELSHLPGYEGNVIVSVVLIGYFTIMIVYDYFEPHILMVLGCGTPEPRRFVARRVVVWAGACGALVAVSALAEIVIGWGKNVFGELDIDFWRICVLAIKLAITYLAARRMEDQGTATDCTS